MVCPCLCNYFEARRVKEKRVRLETQSQNSKDKMRGNTKEERQSNQL